jgi:hypothetical protein
MFGLKRKEVMGELKNVTVRSFMLRSWSDQGG